MNRNVLGLVSRLNMSLCVAQGVKLLNSRTRNNIKPSMSTPCLPHVQKWVVIDISIVFGTMGLMSLYLLFVDAMRA